MEKLFDIRAYWNTGKSDSFDEKDMWEGQFLLDEYGAFEGIVTEPNSSYNEDRFIFGYFTPEEDIVINKITPIDVSAPFVFRAKKDGDCYKGSYSYIDALFGDLVEIPRGLDQIYISDVEKIRTNVDEEAAVLRHMIERWKNNVMDDFDYDMYCRFVDTNENKKFFESSMNPDKTMSFEPIEGTEDLPF